MVMKWMQIPTKSVKFGVNVVPNTAKRSEETTDCGERLKKTS